MAMASCQSNCVCAWLHIREIMSLYIHIYMVNMHMYIYIYIHMCIYTVCVWLHVTYVYIYVYVYIYICIYMYMYIYIYVYIYVYPFIRYMLIAHISTYRHDIFSFFNYSLYRCLWLSRWVRLENDNGSCHRKLWETPQNPLGLNLFCPKIDTVKFGVRIPNISASIYDHQSPGHWTACAGKSPLLLDNSSN